MALHPSAREIRPFSEEIDIVIVPMKNIGIGSSRARIRNDPEHLSFDSRLSLAAAAHVARLRPDLTFLLSGGRTAGPDYPSEAGAGQTYLFRDFPYISNENILTEDKSLNTRQNAEECALLLEGYEHIGLMSLGLHAVNAALMFRRAGVPIEEVVTTQSILRRTESASLVRDRRTSWRSDLEFMKEAIRFVLLQTTDRDGRLLGHISQRTRG